MNKLYWQLKSPIDAISFDCDSTIATIEGIDHLAEQNKCYQKCYELTQAAMQHNQLSQSLYSKRLNLVKPTKDQAIQLAQTYLDNLSLDFTTTLRILQSLGKEIFIISGANNPALSLLARHLSIKHDHVYGIPLYFNTDGSYHSYDSASDLVHRNGKLKIINKLKNKYPRFIHIGDGSNDICLHKNITRFIGYGGNLYNSLVEKNSDFYLHESSFLSLLPLCLTNNEASQLCKSDKAHYEKGLSILKYKEKITKQPFNVA